MVVVEQVELEQQQVLMAHQQLLVEVEVVDFTILLELLLNLEALAVVEMVVVDQTDLQLHRLQEQLTLAVVVEVMVELIQVIQILDVLDQMVALE
jgi:hypothetical protein